MELKVKLYGVLAEIADTQEISVKTESQLTVEELIAKLKHQFPAMKLVQCQLAVNQRISQKITVNHNDQLVLLPPFAGG
ncbi:MAG: molybdopterin converting factor small subunit [Cyclobacteriaceae bacterium]|jgi:molybdopterin converting factor small subunit